MFRLIQCCKQLSLNSTKLLASSRPLISLRNTIVPVLKTLQNSQFQKRFFASVHEINTKVTKDVILFKFENPSFYRIINIFALSQFIFWNYLSHFAYTSLKDAPPSTKDDDSWYRKLPNLGENKYRNAITVMCFLIGEKFQVYQKILIFKIVFLGYGILAVAWSYTLRSVRYLILLKGGQKVSIGESNIYMDPEDSLQKIFITVTYTPFGKNRIIDVPLNCISAEASRDARSTLPLKVKNKSLYYVLDMRGEFKNTKLYDYTVGLKRKLQNFQQNIYCRYKILIINLKLRCL